MREQRQDLLGGTSDETVEINAVPTGGRGRVLADADGEDASFHLRMRGCTCRFAATAARTQSKKDDQADLLQRVGASHASLIFDDVARLE
jgi:hypothetical protein